MYLLRKEKNSRLANQYKITIIDTDYDTDNWLSRAQGVAHGPEHGIRYTMCFDIRFEHTALCAHENGYDVISNSLDISRWNNMQQINDCGISAAEKYPDLLY